MPNLGLANHKFGLKKACFESKLESELERSQGLRVSPYLLALSVEQLQ